MYRGVGTSTSNHGGRSRTPTPAAPESTQSSTTSRTSTLTRKTSFSSSKSPKNSHRRNHSSTFGNFSPEKKKGSSSTHTNAHPLPINIPYLFSAPSNSAANFGQGATGAEVGNSPASERDSFTSTTPYSNMLARPGTGYQNAGPNGPSSFAPMQPPSPTLETITYQHIQETSSKRISTLDYLRKA